MIEALADPQVVAASDPVTILAIAGPIVVALVGGAFAFRKTGAEAKLNEVNYLRGIIEELAQDQERRDRRHREELRARDEIIRELSERIAVLEADSPTPTSELRSRSRRDSS